MGTVIAFPHAANVIRVDFTTQQRLSCEREHYVHILASELDPEDWAEFVDAANDPRAYRAADPDIQDLVDGLYACSTRPGS